MTKQTAVIYRIVSDDHICPYGLKAIDLLKQNDFDIEDHHLVSRKEIEQFKEKHSVETTPQVFIEDKRIGGFDDLEVYFSSDIDSKKDLQNQTTYQPVIAIFAMAILITITFLIGKELPLQISTIIYYFVAFSMCILAIQKLQDLKGFSLQVLNYDILAQRWVKYATLYPFAEAFVGLGMLSKVMLPFVGGVAAFIGFVGSASVIKAVYIDKRELNCACVGGDTNVPLGFVSLTENLMMLFMGFWMMVSM